MLARMGRKGNTFALLVGMQSGVATLENSMDVPLKITNRATQRPGNCTSRCLPKRYTNADSKGHIHSNVITALSTRAKLWVAWVAQSVKHPTSAQVMISQSVGSSPAWGCVLIAQSLETASDSVSPSLSDLLLLTICVSISQK